MQITEERRKNLETEFKFSASRSSGPGGQNVNKVNTRVELRFSLPLSSVLYNEEKQIIQRKLKNRINSEGEMVLVSSIERSQWRNKERVIQKFYILIEEALTPVKKRIKTKPTASSKIKRIEGKKQLSLKKRLRKKPDL